MEPTQIPQIWHTYPALSDGEPALFLYNHGLVVSDRIESASELYIVRIAMVEPGDNGLGTDAEVMWLYNFEDALNPVAEQLGFIHLGRVRSAGGWEMSYYSERGRDLAPALDGAGPIASERPIELTGMNDPEWSYLLGYLAPDQERWQWIMNNQVVVQLEDAGDNLDAPRPVDHSATFRTEDGRVGFVAAIEQQGFEVTAVEDRDAENWQVSFQRMNSARMNEIHPVVMDLVNVVGSFGGAYNGWGCPIAV